MDRTAVLSSLCSKHLKCATGTYHPALSLLYEAKPSVPPELLPDLYSALSDVYAPAVYSATEVKRHRVTLVSGIKEVDKTVGALAGFVEVVGSAFNNALRLVAMYAVDAHAQSLSTLFLTPCRAKVSFFHELTSSVSTSVSSILTTSYMHLLQCLIDLNHNRQPGDLVIIDGLSMLILSGKGIPSDGRDEYLSALLCEIKAISANRTVIVRHIQVLLTTNAEGKALGLSNWHDHGQRSLELRAVAHRLYVLQETTDRIASVHFELP